jgi:hypothetical protein
MIRSLSRARHNQVKDVSRTPQRRLASGACHSSLAQVALYSGSFLVALSKLREILLKLFNMNDKHYNNGEVSIGV